MRVAVLLNSKAGANAAADDRETERRVAEALRVAGVEADIRSLPGDTVSAAAKAAAASGVNAVIAGGGDGTVSAVAGALVGGATPLGVLPIGTLNHFAKDAGVPLTLDEAAATLAARHVVAVDVGQVNGRTFLNNSSLGAYARAVLDRDALQGEAHLGKWLAMTIAVAKTFRRHPLVRVRLETDDGQLVRKTPLVFIGNNEYQLDLLHLGKRLCLDGGKLSIYVATPHTRWGSLKLVLRAAFGRLRQSRDFTTLWATTARIDSPRSRLHVALDGEVVTLAPPLEYCLLPRALKVIVPSPPDS